MYVSDCFVFTVDETHLKLSLRSCYYYKNSFLMHSLADGIALFHESCLFVDAFYSQTIF